MNKTLCDADSYNFKLQHSNTAFFFLILKSAVIIFLFIDGQIQNVKRNYLNKRISLNNLLNLSLMRRIHIYEPQKLNLKKKRTIKKK